MRFLQIILILGLVGPLFALDETLSKPAEGEVARIDHLIEATEQKLQKQKELKGLMLAFHEQEERFFLGDQSKMHAAKMVHSAREILDIIKTSHLEHLFSSEYMEELALFSSIAGKTTPARP